MTFPDSSVYVPHTAFLFAFRRELLRALGLSSALVAMTCTAACGERGIGTSGEATGTDGSSDGATGDPSTSTSAGTDASISSTVGSGSESSVGTTSASEITGETVTSASESTGETTSASESTGETTSASESTGETTGETGETDGPFMCGVEPPEGYMVDEACFPIPEGLDSCAQCEDSCVSYNLNAAITEDPDFCWAEDLSVLCGPEDGVPQEPGMCCYVGAHNGILCEGRPCIVNGELRVAALEPRGDWSECDVSPAVEQLDDATRAALAAAWRQDGLMEHASIAAFSRFIMQLMAVAAPAWLVDDATQAIEDEIAHARLCFGLADVYAGGQRMGPGALEVEDLLEDECTLSAVAAATVREGCVGETIAALLVRDAARRARDPSVRRALETIAADEARHATLAWRMVQWAMAEGGEAVRDAVRAAFDEGLSVIPEPAAWPAGLDAALMAAHGQTSPQRQRVLCQQALVDVIQPCAAAMLDPAGEHRALEILPFAPGATH